MSSVSRCLGRFNCTPPSADEDANSLSVDKIKLLIGCFSKRPPGVEIGESAEAVSQSRYRTTATLNSQQGSSIHRADCSQLQRMSVFALHLMLNQRPATARVYTRLSCSVYQSCLVSSCIAHFGTDKMTDSTLLTIPLPPYCTILSNDTHNPRLWRN